MARTTHSLEHPSDSLHACAAAKLRVTEVLQASHGTSEAGRARHFSEIGAVLAAKKEGSSLHYDI